MTIRATEFCKKYIFHYNRKLSACYVKTVKIILICKPRCDVIIVKVLSNKTLFILSSKYFSYIRNYDEYNSLHLR